MMLTCGEEEDTEVGDTEVSCNFNRGYDRIVTLAQQRKISLGPNLILLDSCSMCYVCNASSLLHNVQYFKVHGLSQGLHIVSNGRTMDCDQVGSIGTLSFPGWYNANLIANILSMSEVVQDWCLIMDTLVENAIWLHREDGQILKFVEHAGGLYAHDRSNPSHEITTHVVNTHIVESHKSKYTCRQAAWADRARNLIQRLAYPSQLEIKKLISNNFFCHNDLLVDDFHQATTIYRPMVEVLKGKGTRAKPQHIPSTVKTVLPSYILTEHKDVTLTADFLAVNGNFVLHTKSRKIHFRTAVSVQDRTKATILKHIKTTITLHNTRGFEVNELIADNEFSCIKDDIISVLLNLMARGERCGDIENSIKFLKERLHCLWNGLPFCCVPWVMITAGINFCIDMINALPASNGISDTLSPATIVTGHEPPNVVNLQLNFGDYVQLQMDNNPTNTMLPQHLDCIALQPTSTTQGKYYFMDLHSG